MAYKIRELAEKIQRRLRTEKSLPTVPFLESVLREEHAELIEKLSKRVAEFKASDLREDLAAASTFQKHLDRGTAERTYWHYGYAVALLDVIGLLQGRPTNLN